MEMQGRVAVVTGGAMGIGRGAAECLSAAGAAVVILDNQEESGRQTALELSRTNPQVAFIRTDISRGEEIAKAIDETVHRFGTVDVLVNNAGIQTFGGPVDTTEELWDRTMNVNLKGHWLVSKAVLSYMLEKGKGAIVNVSSVQGLASQTNVVAYATSKHGMIGLTRSMAVDLAARGVRVNCVCPGTVDTPMIRWIIDRDADPKRLERRLNQMHPIGRIGTPREIGEVILFLASDRASFMTGSIVTVDGGLLVPIAGSPEQSH